MSSRRRQQRRPSGFHYVHADPMAPSNSRTPFRRAAGGGAVIAGTRRAVWVRSPPPVSQALDEYRVRLAVEGLNPRLVGDHLILSLAPPNTPFDASGVTGSHIFVEMLSALSLGRPE